MTLTLTHSPTAMGFVLLCRSLPSVILGPLAGPFADCLPKKPILIITDLVRSAFALSLSLSVVMHLRWILYVGSALLGITGVLFSPARNTTISHIVEETDLATANGLESQASGLIQIAGAAIGGIISATIGPIACFAINAASYLWSAWHIARCHWSESKSIVRCDLQYFHSLKAGFQEALHRRVVRSILLIGISWGLAGGGYYILIPVLGQQVYHMGGLGIGLLYMVDGVGVLLGSSVVNHYAGNSLRRAVFWYGMAYITQALFFGLTTQFTVLAWGAFMLLLMRMSSGIIIPLDTYLLQIGTDKSVQGRVFALHGSSYGGVMQLSFALTGVALSTIAIPLIGIIIGAMSLLCGLSWLAQYRRLYNEISDAAKMSS